MSEFLLLTRVTWRNLFRNYRRTGITMLSIVCYTATIIFFVGLIDGFTKSMSRNISYVLVGDVQVHAPGFLDNRSIYKSIVKPHELMTKIRESENKQVKAVARGLGIGLVSVGIKSAGGTFSGVVPTDEKSAFELHTKMAFGRYLANEAHREVVLGSRIAKSLNAKVGGEMVAVVQAADGSMGNELFTVVGILQAVGESVDRDGIFIHRADYDSLFMADGRVHQIAFNSHGTRKPADLVSEYKPLYPQGDWKSWGELLPALANSMKLNDASFWIIGFIFAVAAALGTMNTMLMATHDRVREFGVIRALGATPWRIVRDIAYESVILGLLATLFGGVIGAGITYYFQVVGLDLAPYTEGNLEMAGIMVDTLWRSELTLGGVLKSMLLIFIVCIISSLYPAIKSARLQPVLAMKHV